MRISLALALGFASGLLAQADFPVLKPTLNYLGKGYEGTVRFTRSCKIAPGTKFAGLEIAGTAAFQSCDPDLCLPPAAVGFAITLR